MAIWKLFIVLAICLFAIEITFRRVYRLRYGRNYHVSIKFPWKDNHVVPHPFLSLAYKPNAVIDRNQPLPYPIHPNKYFSYYRPLRINNLGHFGPDFSTEKPANVIRIACLGSSTTANNLSDGNRDYTYPGLLEDDLRGRFAAHCIEKVPEVYNCGISAWLSTDILIDFQLNILPTKPDYIILYHGLNDLFLYLTEDFAADYSHGYRNLGEVMGKIKRAYVFPKIPFLHSYECLKDTFLGTGNVRNDAFRFLQKQKPDFARSYQDLTVEKNILKNILIICRYYNIRCVLATLAFWVFREKPPRRKYAEGVEIENRHIRELADEFDTMFLDLDRIIPKNETYFVDSLHFTPEGMGLMAKELGRTIVEDLKNQGQDEARPGSVSHGQLILREKDHE